MIRLVRFILRSFKFIVRACLFLFVLVVVLYGFAFWVNLEDDPESDDARYFSQLYSQRPEVAHAKNAYFYLRGIDAPEFSEPFEYGLKRYELIRRNMDNLEYDWSALNALSMDAGKILPVELQDLRRDCSWNYQNCLKALRQQPDWTQQVRSAHWLLERYQKLIQYGEYRDELVFDVNAPMPNYSLALDGQRLLHLSLWQAAKKGDDGIVEDWLAKDGEFWRMMVSSSSTLIDKMIAVAGLRNHFYFGNLIVGSLPLDAQPNAIPESWLQPLTDQERSLASAFTGEYMFGSRIVEQIPEGPDSLRLFFPQLETDGLLDKLLFQLAKPLFKVQASKNYYAMQLRSNLSYEANNYQQLYQLRDVPAEQSKQESPFGLGILLEKNIVGKIIYYQSHTPDIYRTYFVRVADLEGIRQASLAVAELRSKQVLIEDWDDTLQASNYRSPYTGGRFTADIERKAVVFEGLSEGERAFFYAIY